MFSGAGDVVMLSTPARTNTDRLEAFHPPTGVLFRLSMEARGFPLDLPVGGKSQPHFRPVERQCRHARGRIPAFRRSPKAVARWSNAARCWAFLPIDGWARGKHHRSIQCIPAGTIIWSMVRFVGLLGFIGSPPGKRLRSDDEIDGDIGGWHRRDVWIPRRLGPSDSVRVRWWR